MSCRRVERRLLASFDRDLSAPTRLSVERHLETCPRCRAAAREYGEIRRRLAAVPVPEPLPWFQERLRARAAESPVSAVSALWGRLWARAIPVSLSLLAGFALASLILLPSSSGTAGLSETQALVLTEENPIAETRAIIDEGRRDVRDLTVLFAGYEPAAGKR